MYLYIFLLKTELLVLNLIIGVLLTVMLPPLSPPPGSPPSVSKTSEGAGALPLVLEKLQNNMRLARGKPYGSS